MVYIPISTQFSKSFSMLWTIFDEKFVQLIMGNVFRKPKKSLKASNLSSEMPE